MKLGAVLIAAGKNANPLPPSGEITVAQRMIATLQKTGVIRITVVTGPSDKKMEKQLAQYGVFFLQNPQPENQGTSISLGIHSLADKCDWIFLMDADYPLVDPDTLVDMLASAENMVLPCFGGQNGQPLLIKSSCAHRVCTASDMAAMAALPGFVSLPVEDIGVILPATEAEKNFIADHERKLTRLVSEFTISRGKKLLDTKLITLLRQIRETQSVRDACSRMQISYSTAWNMLNFVEEALGYPLLLRNKGGPSGAGSVLTSRGQTLLDAYERFENAAKENVEKLYEAYLGDVI